MLFSGNISAIPLVSCCHRPYFTEFLGISPQIPNFGETHLQLTWPFPITTINRWRTALEAWRNGQVLRLLVDEGQVITKLRHVRRLVGDPGGAPFRWRWKPLNKLLSKTLLRTQPQHVGNCVIFASRILHGELRILGIKVQQIWLPESKRMVYILRSFDWNLA